MLWGPCDCHVIAMWLLCDCVCDCDVFAMWLLCDCHVIAMWLPCACNLEVLWGRAYIGALLPDEGNSEFPIVMRGATNSGGSIEVFDSYLSVSHLSVVSSGVVPYLPYLLKSSTPICWYRTTYYACTYYIYKHIYIYQYIYIYIPCWLPTKTKKCIKIYLHTFIYT